MTEIPKSLGAITAPWLTAALREAGHSSPDIASVSYQPMPGIVGAMGEIGTLSVVYDEPTTLPTTFVGKCPLDDDFARMYNQIMQMYSREVGFYRDLNHTVPMNLAQCYVNLSDPDTGHTMLIIEHISPSRDGDILQGSSFETMLRLVRDMAVMHGRHWMNDDLNQLPWMLNWDVQSFRLGIPIVQDTWARYNEAHPGRFPAALKDVLERTWINDTETWLLKFNERPWTFTHGDYELDNMLFVPTADGGEDVVVIDWQTVQRSFPGTDLAWLLSTSSTDECVAREHELLDAYRDTLAESGGPTWTHERLVEDLAWGVSFWAGTSVVTAMQDLAPFGDKADRMRRRFEKFMLGSIAGAGRWDTVGHLTPHL